jgi:hypothetical protein
MRRQAPLALLALFALGLAACALPGDEHTFSAGRVTVTDGSGLVTGATAGAPEPESDERPLVVSPGSLTQIAVHWVGSGCVGAWRITIPEGNALRVRIAPQGAAAEPCSAGDEELAVTLDLNRVVEADGIEVEQTEAP